ncbi:MAG TPA: hypothetical protein VFY89_03325, partial [Ktedonobacterales bacterium]
MDQLINQIAQQTGISQSQAQKAVQMVISFAKGRLPAPLASQVENALTGQGGMQGMPNMPGMPNQMQQGMPNQGMPNQGMPNQ